MLYTENHGRWDDFTSQNERKGKHQSDVCASKCRLRICSVAKPWRRRHFDTNGPFCVHIQKNRHEQFSQWYILTCISALYNCSQMAGACVCVYMCLELKIMQKAWEVVYQQNSAWAKHLKMKTVTRKGGKKQKKKPNMSILAARDESWLPWTVCSWPQTITCVWIRQLKHYPLQLWISHYMVKFRL